MGRYSVITGIGRGFQKISPAFACLDSMLGLPVLLRPKSEFPVVILLAPSRSGSTLTYQLLTTAFQNHHLTNIWNLLYAMPAFGGWMSEKMCRKKTSAFRSQQGFVKGLCGEAEGLRFWSYHAGITIDAKNQGFNQKCARRFVHKLQHLCSDESAFISGYLGHVLAIEELKQMFPKAVFIYLQRNLLSNAISLYNVSAESWYSVKTKSFAEVQAKDRFTQIARQLMDIHSLIRNGKDERFYTLRYETLCDKPEEVIRDFKTFADKQGVHLQRKSVTIPDSFPYKLKLPSDNEINQRQYEALEREVSFLDGEVREEMKKLL